MIFTLLVDRKAVDQATEVFQYYSAIRKELGQRFARELDACYTFIAHNPMGYAVRMRDYRHARVKGFNYRVIYAIRGQVVIVYRIRHTSQKSSKRFGP
jgi:mRNA-degrading endonuclease RelE of RelBE toxin-antitoxin system